MANYNTAKKIRILHAIYYQKDINIIKTANRYNISRNTLKRYIAEVRLYKKECSDDMCSLNYFISLLKKTKQRNHKNEKYLSLTSLFSSVYNSITINNSNRKIEWQKYKSEDPEGLSYSQFTYYFSKWLKENNLSILQNFQIKTTIQDEDLKILKKWRKSTDRRKWEKAVVLLERNMGKSVPYIETKIERSRRKIIKWIKSYEKDGLEGLETKKKVFNVRFIQNIEIKKSNLIKLIHESPKNYGVNRTSWDLKSLSTIYSQVYNLKISRTMISEYIKSQGYGFRKAKKVLTSPDPKYKEKLSNITTILTNLTEREKFFSVDEYGPFSIKIQGGSSLIKIGEERTFPQWQKNKGSLICTAGLELSQNQITHFYSLKKNTEEMIKLLEILLFKYKGEDKIYFSWDAASWHASKKLYERIDEVNKEEYRGTNQTPLVELAPLPSSAQFLNVIESVFSGMAKGIIHNSDYQSVDECKAAIDRYFFERNDYFQKFPKRAGKKIWGMERNKAVFDESKNFKDPKWR